MTYICPHACPVHLSTYDTPTEGVVVTNPRDVANNAIVAAYNGLKLAILMVALQERDAQPYALTDELVDIADDGNVH